MTKLELLRAYAAAGYTLIPVCSPTEPHKHKAPDGTMKPCKAMGKVPPFGGWEDTEAGTYPPEQLAGGNYGIALRAEDLVVDVDPRNFAPGDNPLRRLVEKVGPLSTFTVKTGGDGLHAYFKKPVEIRVAGGHVNYQGLEFKSAGRQVVGPGSLHAGSGKLYEVAVGGPGAVAQAPAALLELLRRPDVPFADLPGTGTYVSDQETQGRFLAYLTDVADVSIEGQRGDENAFRVACRGRDLGLPPGITLELMLSDWNDRCSPPWEVEELKAKVANAYRYARGAVGSAHPAAKFDVVAPEAKVDDPEVLKFALDGRGNVIRNFKNLLLYLTVPECGLSEVFGYNEFTNRAEFINPAPWHRGHLPSPPAITDNDVALLKGFLATRHRFEVSIADIETAIRNVAQRRRFHPVREWLASLKWDGRPRIDSWMKDYLGAVDGGYPEYLAAVSRKILVAAVMRVIRPGIKFDHVPVLEGDQNLGKSSTVDILGGSWASDAPVDPHNRDTVDSMQGRWFIEMAEMEARGKVDRDALKAFISRRVDRVRLAYGRATHDYPRQSVFIATKNPGPDGAYLDDPTGERRWWPVRLEPPADPETGLRQIDFAGLRAAREQLFAEAYVAAQNVKHPRELSMQTQELKAQADAVAAGRRVEHEFTERIAAWIAQQDAKPETRREFLTSRDVWVDALGGSDHRLDQRAQRAIASCLRGLGWERGVVWKDGRSARGYVREKSLYDVAALMAAI